jgi:hypothetical protein
MAKAIAAYVSGRGQLVVPVEEFRARVLALPAFPEGGLPDPEDVPDPRVPPQEEEEEEEEQEEEEEEVPA